MEQFGQQYISRIEQLQVSSTRTLTQVEDKLGQLQERARVWDTFQSVITSWTDLLVGTDRKMDLIKEGIERTAELYGSISPYSAVAYQVDQLNVKLSRLLTKIPENGANMFNDFAIKGVMATLRELKTKIESMNRRRFVVKKVVNTDAGPARASSGGDTHDVQYRDIQDELEEAISSNNMLNAIEVKVDRIEAVVGGMVGTRVGAGVALRNRNVTMVVERRRERPVSAGSARPFPDVRQHRAHAGERRGRRGGDRSGGGSGVVCERLLKQWTEMELNFDQFDAVREAVGRMEDVLDYRTSTVDVKLDRLEDLLYRQGTKLDKSDVTARHNHDAVTARLQALGVQAAESGAAVVGAVNNMTERAEAAVQQLSPHMLRAEQLLVNISDATSAWKNQTVDASANSTEQLRRLGEAISAVEQHINGTRMQLGRLASRPCGGGGEAAPPSVAPPSADGERSGRPQLGLRGCEDLAELDMTVDIRYRFGDALSPLDGLDYMERYCDMTTDGGGWTIIQRRNDFGAPKLNFSQSWQAYKHGFGDIEKEFWFGNENIHKLTNEQDVSLRVDLEDFEGNTAYAVYTKFKVSGEEHGYTLEVAGYHGNASDSLTSHSLSQFSTWDVTNDKAPPCCPCANAYGGGWWFNSCFESNLNGEYHMDPLQNDHYHGIIWELWKGDYSLRAVEMKVRALSYRHHPSAAAPLAAATMLPPTATEATSVAATETAPAATATIESASDVNTTPLPTSAASAGETAAQTTQGVAESTVVPMAAASAVTATEHQSTIESPSA